MLEPPVSSHPTDDDLQRVADGDVDAGSDASLLAHVSACPHCRAELERVRRVTAALSLSSVAPDALLEKIRQRQAQEGIASPLPGSRLRSGPRLRSGRRLRMLVPAGLAAAVILALLTESAWRPDSTPGEKSKAADEPPARLIIALDDWRQPAMDSVLIAVRDREATVDISFGHRQSKSALSGRRLADSVAGYLRARGISAERVTVAQRTTGADPQAGLVTITIVRGPSP